MLKFERSETWVMCDIYVISQSEFASNTDLVAVCCVWRGWRH